MGLTALFSLVPLAPGPGLVSSVDMSLRLRGRSADVEPVTAALLLGTDLLRSGLGVVDEGYGEVML
jgi:hypothetical protein